MVKMSALTLRIFSATEAAPPLPPPTLPQKSLLSQGSQRQGRAMTLSDQISDDIKNAMRAKDTIALTTLRALKSAVKNAAIEKGGADATLDDTEVTNVIRKQIKQRQDSVAQFEQANRLELVEKEKSEIEVLEKYLPKALSQAEIDQAVAESIAEVGATSRADMGKVMKVLQQKTGGRADGKTLSQAVQTKLS